MIPHSPWNTRMNSHLSSIKPEASFFCNVLNRSLFVQDKISLSFIDKINYKKS